MRLRSISRGPVVLVVARCVRLGFVRSQDRTGEQDRRRRVAQHVRRREDVGRHVLGEGRRRERQCRRRQRRELLRRRRRRESASHRRRRSPTPPASRGRRSRWARETGAHANRARRQRRDDTVTATVTATPGPLATLVSSPKSIKLGRRRHGADHLAARRRVRERRHGTRAQLQRRRPDARERRRDGLVRALRAGRHDHAHRQRVGRSDTVSVNVLAAGQSPCTGIAQPDSSAAVGGHGDRHEHLPDGCGGCRARRVHGRRLQLVDRTARRHSVGNSRVRRRHAAHESQRRRPRRVRSGSRRPTGLSACDDEAALDETFHLAPAREAREA